MLRHLGVDRFEGLQQLVLLSGGHHPPGLYPQVGGERVAGGAVRFGEIRLGEVCRRAQQRLLRFFVAAFHCQVAHFEPAEAAFASGEFAHFLKVLIGTFPLLALREMAQQGEL